MSFKFEFDPNAFERAIRKDVKAHVTDLSREMTRDFDRLRAQCAGRPAKEIKPVLKRLWERAAARLPTPSSRSTRR